MMILINSPWHRRAGRGHFHSQAALDTALYRACGFAYGIIDAVDRWPERNRQCRNHILSILAAKKPFPRRSMLITYAATVGIASPTSSLLNTHAATPSEALGNQKPVDLMARHHMKAGYYLFPISRRKMVIDSMIMYMLKLDDGALFRPSSTSTISTR